VSKFTAIEKFLFVVLAIMVAAAIMLRVHKYGMCRDQGLTSLYCVLD
jgi:hypothetical protein